MPLLQVSGVTAGPPVTITHPLNGRPHAEVKLGVTEVPWQPGDQVKLKFDLEKAPPEYLMTVERVGLRGGFIAVQLVGGTGGLSRDVEAKWYQDIPVETVVRELLDECGERLGTLDLPGTLPKWVRPAGPAHEALRAIMMRFPQRIWWMDHEGKVHAGAPKWEDFETELPLEQFDAAKGLYVVPFTPVLTANRRVTMTRGTEKVEKRVTRVEHRITEAYDYPRNSTHLRTVIQVGDGRDPGRYGLDTVTQQATRWTDYCALYPCEVLRDHGNHTLDLRPEHPLLPDMTEVRLVQPISGAKVKIRAGATVLLEFQGGDPARPVVTGYAASVLERFEIVTGRGQGVVIDDDRGQKSPDDHEYVRPHVQVVDAAGQLVELWAQSGKERVRVRDAAGQEFLMDAASGREQLEWRGKSGSLLRLDGVTGDVTLKATGKLDLQSGTAMNMQAGAAMTVQAGATLAVNSALATTVTAGAALTLSAGAVLTLGGAGIVMASTAGLSLGSAGRLKLTPGAGFEMSTPGEIKLETPMSASITSGDQLWLQSTHDLSVKSGGNVTLDSGGTLNMLAAGRVNVQTNADLSMTANQGTLAFGGAVTLSGAGVSVSASGTLTLGSFIEVNVDAPKVRLAGDKPVVRVGDTVTVIGSTSNGGTFNVTATLQEGSSVVGAG